MSDTPITEKSVTDEAAEAAAEAITSVLHAIADQHHEHLCNCRAYPDDCLSTSSYTRDAIVAGLHGVETGLEEAWRQGWRPTTDLRPGDTAVWRGREVKVLATDQVLIEDLGEALTRDANELELPSPAASLRGER